MSQPPIPPGFTESELAELVIGARLAAAGGERLDQFIREVLGKDVDAPPSE